jgi:hypothetical protein
MDPISTLRQQAAKKRDAAIQSARDEYRRTVQMLDTVGLRLGYAIQTTRGTPRKRPIAELIIEHMPRDRAFALRDILAILRDPEPNRLFIEASVRTMFKQLIDENRVRKVRKGSHGFMQWAAPECDITSQGPLAIVSITEAIEHVLNAEGPLRDVEIVLAVQKQGYRVDATPRSLLQTIRQALKRYPERFTVLDDGHWQTA